MPNGELSYCRGRASVGQESAPSITTLKGRIYHAVKVTIVEPDGITVKHNSGVAKLLFIELPQSLRDQYDYNHVEAEQFAYEKYAAQQSAIQNRNNSADDIDDSWDHNNPASSVEWIIFQGAVITEPAVTFAIVIVKPSAVDSASLANNNISSFTPVFGVYTSCSDGSGLERQSHIFWPQ